MMTESRSDRSTTEDSNLLGRSEDPIFFPFDTVASVGLVLPENRHGQSVRVWARSLVGMQKEALVASTQSGVGWRLASDEGPYLDGYDAAPCPLAFMTVGMVSCYMNELLAVAKQRGVDLGDFMLIQDSRYTMEGSALQGTMTGGALPVELEVCVGGRADDAAVAEVVTAAVASAPVAGLLRAAHTSLFSLTVDGAAVDVDRVSGIGGVAEPDPGFVFSALRPASGYTGGLVDRLEAVESLTGVAGGAGTSLQADQRRQLHLRARCRRRPDGVKEIDQYLYRPLGSTFRFFSDEAVDGGGTGRAPDAASYMAAGIAFCFMTQQGRYASIMKKDLSAYRVVQDLHVSSGVSGGDVGVGVADAVETHVYVETVEGEAFARQSIDMAEQTCFLHALCRTPLEPIVSITRLSP